MSPCLWQIAGEWHVTDVCSTSCALGAKNILGAQRQCSALDPPLPVPLCHVTPPVWAWFFTMVDEGYAELTEELSS